MLAWIQRGLSKGPITMRWPQGATTRWPQGAATRRPQGAATRWRQGAATRWRRRRDGEGLPVELHTLHPGEEPYLAAGARPLAERSRALRRSIHVRHIDCGSDGSEEWEIQALWNPYYDIQRLGFFLTAAPKHADILLVTGPVTTPMREPLLRTWQVMPEPKALVAVGTDACGGGLYVADRSLPPQGRLTCGGVAEVLPVDVYVPGTPPTPVAIMRGLLLATGLTNDRPTTLSQPQRA